MKRPTPPLFLLAALCALPPLSIDMGLPGLPATGAAFGVGADRASLTVTLFVAGFALSPVVFGALSDRVGRRRLVLAGLALFALGGIACVAAPSFAALLAARFVQGAGAGCGPTLAFAASRDTLDGERLGKRLAVLAALLNTAPVVAPTLGTAVLGFGGWRGVPAVLAVLGAGLLVAGVFAFPETRAGTTAPENDGTFATLRRDTFLLVRRRDVVRPGAIYALGAGSMFAYVSASPLLLMERLGAGHVLYAALFAMTGGAIVVGAAVSGRLLRSSGAMLLLAAGIVLAIAGPVVAGALLTTTRAGPVAVAASVMVATFGYGLLVPASFRAALDPVPDLAGTAAALMNSAQMSCMALASLLASLGFARFGATAPPLVMAVFALGSAGCLVFIRPRSRQSGVPADVAATGPAAASD